MSRVNRGNPSLHSQSALGGTGAGLRGASRPTGASSSAGGGAATSYAGASRAGAAGSPAAAPSGGDWGASPASASSRASALKAQGNNPTSPNPYASAFAPSSSSPWTTPAGGGAGGGAGRYTKRISGSGPSGASGTAARTLFPGSSGPDGDRYGKAAGGAHNNWDDHGSDTASVTSQPGAGEQAEGSSSLLRSTAGAGNNHPEHWESYDAGASASSNVSSLPSAANTEPASLNLTPFDSPSLASMRGGDLAGEKLLLDERGTDLSLSLMKHKPSAAEGNNEVSIHMLSLLYDPPVQGCELKPYISVLDSFGRVTAIVSDEAALAIDTRWFRGQKRVCSNSAANCSKAATMQCIPCSKLSPSVVPQHLTYFCSDKCLRDNWQQHKQLHMQLSTQSKQKEIEWSCDEETEHTVTASSDAPSQLYCKYPALLQNTWQEIGAERSYVPAADDVGRALRLECSPVLKGPSKKERPEGAVTSTSSLTSELNLGTVVRIDTGAVIPTPQPAPPRPMVYTDPSQPVNSANTFRTVCYNVLAQIYATRMVYPYTAIWALSWEYRKHLLLREIVSHHADVICLQEVQSNHFESFFQPQLSKHGYDGIFKRKTRDAGSDAAGAQMIDGCATFYKRERFALMEQYGIEFNEAARQHTANRAQLRRLVRGNIALVLVLEELTPPPNSANSAAARRNRKRRLCITNTHIFWDPEYPDVKLWQTWVLCQELEKLVLPRNLPLVLCGDFNSLVESSVYELLSTERVEQGEDVFGATGDPSGLLPAPHLVSHRLPLLSAYATIGEPKYTNYTGSFVGVLDYIFFTRTHLRCVACLDVDEEGLLRQHTALPSPHYPSDHLPLLVSLEFID